MKPIATVHWLTDGDEHSLNLFDQPSINNMVTNLTREGYANWTCLLPGGGPPLLRPPERHSEAREGLNHLRLAK